MNSLLDDMIAHGYRMVVAVENGQAVGVSGIWVTSKFYCGKYMELDNVVVAASHRSAGIGRMLTDFMTELAVQEGCVTMMLDAYLENEKAHTFYKREGFAPKGYHFIKKIG